MDTTIIINSEGLGRGNDELGKVLLASFLRKLWASEKKPDAILFYNTAVSLLVEKSPVMDALTGLTKAGVDLVACSTCVKALNLEGKIAIGRVSDMVEIVSILMKSGKVITP